MVDLVALPEPDEVVRCAEFNRELGADPVGTAFRADLLLAVDLPLPWPKPVFAHEALIDVPEIVRAAPQPSRVLASVPEAEPPQITAYRRNPSTGQVVRTAFETSLANIGSTVAALVEGREPVDADPLTTATAAPEVWICTQGSHDVCCGSEGMRLVQQIRERWPDLVVRRVSHTGGHRFAPTGITLPDGRMWANLRVADIEALVGRSALAAELAARCRGWWGAESGAAQAAERAVFAAEGWDLDAQHRVVELVEEHANVAVFRVAIGSPPVRSWRVEVVAGRTLPTISCGAPGGLPVKQGREYVVADLSAEVNQTHT